MSILNEIKDSHDTIKSVALNAFLMPFWYASIYLFNNQFYKSADTIIITVMCFLLSISSSAIFTHICMMSQDSLNKTREEKQEYTILDNMILTIFVLSTWLSILIFVFYSLGFLFGIYIFFYYYIVIYFTPILFIYLMKVTNK